MSLLRCFRGDLLGHGASRKVYEYRDLESGSWDKYVIKIAHNADGHMDNIMEFQIYGSASDRLNRWLVPNILIDKQGKYLICRRAEKLQKHQNLKKVPAIFNDTHKNNWMWYEGKIRCADYGIIHVGCKDPFKMVKTWGWD